MKFLLSRYLPLLVLSLFAPLTNAQTSTPIYYQSGPSTVIKPLNGFVGFEVPVERAGHSFTVYANGGAAIIHQVKGLVTNGGPGGAAADVRHLLVTAKLRTGAASFWWVRDNTASQETPHIAGVPSGITSLMNTTWTTTSGVANRYFSLPEARATHGLIYGNLSGAWSAWSPMSNIKQVGTYAAGTTGTQVLLPWVTASATEVANPATAFIVDRTASQRSSDGVTDLRLGGTWVNDAATASYPLSWIKVQLEAREKGHVFTVRSALPDMPEQSIKVSAMADGAQAALSLVLPTGSSFRVTRDAEDGDAAQPSAMVSGVSWAAAGTPPVSAVGVFPAVPARASTLVTRTFRVNARTRSNHQFTVRMSDGYTATFGPTASGSIQAYATAVMPGSLNGTTPHNLPIYEFSTMIDPSRLVTLRDDTDGSELGVGIDPHPTSQAPVDWFDGWEENQDVPAPESSIALRLSSAHIMDLFRLRRIPLDSWSKNLGTTDPDNGSRTFLSLEIGGSTPQTGVEGMSDYWLEHSSFSVAHPLTAAEPGPFLLENVTTQQSREGIYTGLNVLIDWFERPKPLNLQISSSRQGHRLVIRHPNGEFFPVQHGPIAGLNASGPPYLPFWYESYYYFDATASARSEMPWYIEDIDTGDRLGAAIPLTGPTGGSTVTLGPSTGLQSISLLAGPSNSDLINWIAVPAPHSLVVAERLDGTFDLEWNSAATSTEGAFKLERLENADEDWYLLDTFLAAETFNPTTGKAHARTPLAPSEPDKTASIRIFYQYGSKRSIPSNSVDLVNGDSDFDGMPDWWEKAHGLDNANPTSAPTADADGDGITNLAEFTAGTDPRNFYNGVLPVIALIDGDEQVGAPGTLLANPLVVEVTDSSGILANAPVTFKVTLGKDGKIRETASGADHETISLLTNAAGRAQVFYLSPNRHNVRSRITVSAKAGARSATASFTAATTPDPVGTNNPSSAPDEDWDGDGLTNAEEEDIGSDPKSDQTDDDGVADGLDAMPADSDISFPRAGSPHYALIDIGPGTISAINDKGQVVGMAPPAPGAVASGPTPFFWDKGVRKNLQGRKPVPRAINDSGEIVGEAEFGEPDSGGLYPIHAAYWASAEVAPVDLGVLIEKDGRDPDKTMDYREKGRSSAVAINNSGMIAGISSWYSTSDQAVGSKATQFKSGAKPTHLGPGKVDDVISAVTITGLDDNGNVVGYIEGGINAGAALWEGGKYSRNLGTDLRPSGITAAPPDDLRYKYYISASDKFSGQGVILLGARDGSGIVTVSMPVSNSLGITTTGLASTADRHQWRNGKDEDLTTVPPFKTPPPAVTGDSPTVDQIMVQTANGLLGGSITITATGARNGGLLHPVEILDKDKKVVNKLKVAKLVESGVLSGSGTSVTLDPEKDSDCFYIRVIDASQRGKNPKARLWTESEDQRYSDNPSMQENIIELDDDPSNPAGLISKSLLLMSDGWDDAHKVNGINDNAVNDRTRRIAIGGKVRFEYLAHKSAATGVADAEAEVAIQKTVAVKIYNCQNGFPGLKSPIFPQDRLDSQGDRIKERFAQCGIKTVVTTAVGRDIGILGNVDPLVWNPPSPVSIPQSCADLFTDPGPREIGVYLVRAFQHAGTDKGQATVFKIVSAADRAAGYANKCIISSKANPHTTAHELLHILLNAVHRDNSPDYPTEFANPNMLWQAPSIWNDAINDSKRISPKQAEDIVGKSGNPPKSPFPQ